MQKICKVQQGMRTLRLQILERDILFESDVWIASSSRREGTRQVSIAEAHRSSSVLFLRGKNEPPEEA